MGGGPSTVLGALTWPAARAGRWCRTAGAGRDRHPATASCPQPPVNAGADGQRRGSIAGTHVNNPKTYFPFQIYEQLQKKHTVL